MWSDERDVPMKQTAVDGSRAMAGAGRAGMHEWVVFIFDSSDEFMVHISVDGWFLGDEGFYSWFKVYGACTCAQVIFEMY